jgi:hypothetical protein
MHIFSVYAPYDRTMLHLLRNLGAEDCRSREYCHDGRAGEGDHDKRIDDEWLELPLFDSPLMFYLGLHTVLIPLRFLAAIAFLFCTSMILWNIVSTTAKGTR